MMDEDHEWMDACQKWLNFKIDGTLREDVIAPRGTCEKVQQPQLSEISRAFQPNPAFNKNGKERHICGARNSCRKIG